MNLPRVMHAISEKRGRVELDSQTSKWRKQVKSSANVPRSPKFKTLICSRCATIAHEGLQFFACHWKGIAMTW